MSDIQRYAPWPQEWPQEDPDGDLVEYEDHKKIVDALKARAKRLEAALRVIGGNNCVTCSAEAFNALFAERHPSAALKGADHD